MLLRKQHSVYSSGRRYRTYCIVARPWIPTRKTRLVLLLLRSLPHRCVANRHSPSELLHLTVLQVGLITFLLGVLRLGFIDVVLSRALLRGFITAIAVVIMM